MRYHWLEEKDYRVLWRTSSIEKHQAIKLYLDGLIKYHQLKKDDKELDDEEYAALDLLNRTNDDFCVAIQALKNVPDYYRIRSVYCFDIVEHPDYLKTKKILARIRRLKGEVMPVH